LGDREQVDLEHVGESYEVDQDVSELILDIAGASAIARSFGVWDRSQSRAAATV